MNKKKFAKFGMLILLAGILILTSSVFATTTTNNQEASRVVYFSIQSNNLCGQNKTTQYTTGITLNINNLSDAENEVLITLYKKDGSEFTQPGRTENGHVSDFIPGTNKSLLPRSTIQYYVPFGNDDMLVDYSCDERPTFGKITIYTNNGPIMASGEVQGLKRITDTSSTPKNNALLYNNSTIFINEGKPF